MQFSKSNEKLPRLRRGIAILTGCFATVPLLVAVSAWCSVAAFEEAAFVQAADHNVSSQKLDPAAWGSDHVGKELPEYVTGDECLFCHRDIGKTWPANRHQSTVRPAAADSPELKAVRVESETAPFAGEIEFLMGHSVRNKFLKRGREFGTLSILSAELEIVSGENAPAKLIHHANPHWDEKSFGLRCAGCHTTGVDAKTQAFSAVALDCYVCHGNATLDHSKDTSQMIFSRARHDSPRVVASICGQCHIRTGRSKSSGLPYPNNFVAGDNLFRDFEVDFSDAAIEKLNPGDRHVLENIRDVVVDGLESITCLSCHDVHQSSSRKHQRLAEGRICRNCHNAAGPKSDRPAYRVQSDLCGY